MRLLFLIPLALLAAGCAQHQPARITMAPPPPYFVPTAAIVQFDDTPQIPTLASQILPSSDGDMYIARSEKVALGNMPLAEYSSYYVYTFDAQTIGSRRFGSGYRYRWSMQSGLSMP